MDADHGIGDDTLHTPIPKYPLPHYFDARASFPDSGNPDTVDFIFFDQ